MGASLAAGGARLATIETIVRSINRDLVPRFEERLRAVLAEQDREWLIDQIVRLTLDAHSLDEIDRRSVAAASSSLSRRPIADSRASRPRNNIFEANSAITVTAFMRSP